MAGSGESAPAPGAARDSLRRRIELGGQIALAAVGVVFPALLGWVPGWADGRATMDASLCEVLLVVPSLLLLPAAAAALSLRPGRVRIAAALPFVFFAAFLALGAFQLLPLPQELHDSLSPGFAGLAAKYWPVGSPGPDFPRPLSVSPRDTLLALLRLSAVFSCLLGAFAFIRTRRDLFRVFTPLVAVAGLLSFLSIIKSGLHVALGQKAFSGSLLLFPQGGTGARASGPFINANQLAGYLEILFPAAVALLLASGKPAAGEEPGARLLSLARDPRRILLASCALLMAGAVLVTQSRLGILAFVVGSGLLVVLLVRGYGLKFRAALAGGALVLGFFLYLGLDPVLNRYAILAEAEVDRIKAWGMGTEIISDFPLLGTGLGTFHRISPAYTPPEFVNLHYYQTHNDYLNAASDAGLAGLALLLLAAGTFGFAAWRRYAGARGPAALFPAAALAAAGAAALHSVGDFNLQVGSIAVHLALLGGAGLSAALPEGEAAGAGEPDPAPKEEPPPLAASAEEALPEPAEPGGGGEEEA